MKNPLTTTAQRLRMLRARDRLSQDQVADRIGMSQNAVGTWERGSSEPQASELAKLADLYDVAADYILGRTDHPHGLQPGMWLVDLDQAGAPAAGETWAIEIPRNARIVSHSEMRRLRRDGLRRMREGDQ